jgi:geranylgeranyl pyrophosphate synthase
MTLWVLKTPEGEKWRREVFCVDIAQVGIETLQYIHEHKTAALLEASVVCGALVGGAGEPDVERLRKYARNIGLAFQVHSLRSGACMGLNS